MGTPQCDLLMPSLIILQKLGAVTNLGKILATAAMAVPKAVLREHTHKCMQAEPSTLTRRGALIRNFTTRKRTLRSVSF